MSDVRGDLLEIDGKKVDPSIFTQGFVSGCDMKICYGECCYKGVYLDMEFRKVILGNKGIIKEVMSDDQIKDESRWFDKEIEEDDDFPSGLAAGTSVYTDRNGVERCVFNDENFYCSLQVAAVKNGMHKWAIKPQYCIMYPVTVADGVITYDDSHSEDLKYCGKHREENFTQSVFDAMHEEIKFIFGEDFYSKLYEFNKANFSPKYEIKIPEIFKKQA